MRKRTDNIQKEIIQQLQQLGFLVASTSDTGNGAPDILVSGYDVNQNRNRLTWIELKTDNAQLRPNQEEFHSLWQDHDVFVARSLEDVLKIYGRI